MIAIPAPFRVIAEMPSPTNGPLLVMEFPVPAVAGLSAAWSSPVPGVDARRVVLGLGPGRNTRVAHVAACWRYRNYETFEELLALVDIGGHLLAWHTPYGVDDEERAAIKVAAQEALSVALIGDIWPVILRHLDIHPGRANRRTDEECYDIVEPITDKKIAEVVPQLRTALWATHTLYHLGRPTNLLSVDAWPKDGWRLLDRG